MQAQDISNVPDFDEVHDELLDLVADHPDAQVKELAWQVFNDLIWQDHVISSPHGAH